VIYFAHPVSIYHLKLFHHNVSNFVFKLWSCTLSRVSLENQKLKSLPGICSPFELREVVSATKSRKL
jgi:hypothetical protein